jgi:mRNA-degrading endonuclease RelE of RelBE toxin-antitoxin system
MTIEGRETPWRVDFSSSAEKQKKQLSDKLRDVLYTLKHDLEQKGPTQISWRNYSQIVNAAGFHHWHINNGRPRYVVVWQVIDLEDRIIEIRFVGPHGSVNYNRFK